jgi:uncharacterized coiled-coil protein SlyX
MVLTKLQEALAEIPAQRKALDEVEAQLRSMIAKLRGMPDVFGYTVPSTIPPPGSEMFVREKDKIEEIADILRVDGKPLHITIIAERLSALRGTKILRTAIEPGLNRHIAKTKVPRVEKFGPSTFGLPEWKHSQFARTA